MSRTIHPFGFSRACLLAGNVSWLQHFVRSIRHERKAAGCTAFPNFNFHSPTVRRSSVVTTRTASTASAAQDPTKEPDEKSPPSFPSSKVVVPLAERDGKVVASATQVLEWREWARARAAANEGSRCDTSDDGSPTIENLFTEVDWIVEDAVAGISDAQSGGDGAWRDMGQLLAGHGLPRGGQVLLREDLDEREELANDNGATASTRPSAAPIIRSTNL